MKKILLTLLIVAFALPATDALAKRKQVYIVKPSQPVAQQAPLAVVPVFGVAFDIVRRTSCDPAVARPVGKNDPGWPETGGVMVGNFLLPAIHFRCGGAQPKRSS